MKKDKAEYLTYLIMEEIEKADDEGKINILSEEREAIEQIILNVLEGFSEF